MDSLNKLANFLGKNFGKQYNYSEDVVLFAIRMFTELLNRNKALEIQLSEALNTEIPAKVTVGFPTLRDLLSGQTSTISIDKRMIVIEPDEALLRFIREIE